MKNKTHIFAFFILFINISCSQNTKVNFENELTYKDIDGHSIWYISNKYPNLLSRRTIPFSQDFLFYQERFSHYSLNKNKEIKYKELSFLRNTNKTEITKITKSNKNEVVNGFKCDKFILETNYNIFEVFINNESKINNIYYLNWFFFINDKDISVFEKGLIVKISIYNPELKKDITYLELLDIAKSDKSIFVDFEKLNLIINQPKRDGYHVYQE